MDTKTTQADRESRMRDEDGSETKSLQDVASMLNNIVTPAEKLRQEELQLELLAARVKPSTGTVPVPVRDLFESPTNPRSRAPDLEEMVRSVRNVGVMIALTGRRVGEKIEVVDGNCRLRVAKQLGIDELMVDVREMSDTDVLEVQAIAALQRIDLHEMEEAEHYGRMRTAGYTAETIAKKLGKHLSRVNARLKLLELGAEGRAALLEGHDRGGIPISAAVPLARIPGRDNQKKALAAITRVPMTAQAMIEILQKEFSQNLKGAPFDLNDETLLEGRPSCKKCPENSNNQPSALSNDFPRIEKQGVCFNTPCHAQKCREQFKRFAEKAKDRGAVVLSATEIAKTVKDDSIAYEANYVRATDVVHKDKQHRTWEQILAKVEEDAPKLHVGPDPIRPGQPIKLYLRKEAFDAARALGLKWAEEEKPAPRPAKTPEEKKDAQRQRQKENAAKMKQEAVLTVTKLTVPRLVREKWAKKSGLPELRVLVAELFAKRQLFDKEDQEVVFAGFEIVKEGIPSERAVESWISKDATKEELIAFAMVLVCYRKWTDTNDDFEASFADLAYAAGADLTKGLRSQQETMALEAEKKKGKAKE